MTDLERDWLARIKQTMALDISRSISAGMPPKAIVERLLEIPEVRQALEMRARGTTDRPATQIEITPEMIAAGVETMLAFHPGDPKEAIVLAVLRAAIPLSTHRT